MFKNQEILFGVISSIFILIYVSIYILQDIYLLISSKYLKSTINKVLPALNKLNTISLILALVFMIPHIYYLREQLTSFDTGYILLFLLMIATFTKIHFLSKFNIKQYSSIIAYLLTINLAVHIFFR
ncbi:MAG: hypothetical protein E7C86_03285 [Paeniclostridium sordellii]|uniref:Uncharacterized protein n=1 Tax=Paeniclostridium hominis TaxID=2764329 RepID=A0ABR7K3U0_9FIRM|nr:MULTISPECIES: hypothetical protein [Paeniclostridium]MBC6003778.1 hypothetical protein [Paeniclostridium hominis]MBC8632661.1 hypothetical protein [[Eubacterium] tenue]MDU1538983.1 hypothetical protein [Paeniclostridium sordellii]MDU2591624.1 hypothetical protein [Paeniclostridium sordellii]